MNKTVTGRNKHVSIDDAWDYDNEPACTDIQSLKKDLMKEADRISDSIKRDAIKIAEYQPARILDLVRLGILVRPKAEVGVEEESGFHIFNVENILRDRKELTYLEIRILEELLKTDISVVDRIASMEFIRQFATRRLDELHEEKYQEDLISSY